MGSAIYVLLVTDFGLSGAECLAVLLLAVVACLWFTFLGFVDISLVGLLDGSVL